jgi:hypothetical protein
MSDTLHADRVIRSVTVKCDAGTAFRIWTEKIEAWWPEGHTPSGSGGSQIRMQTGPGGRIFELLADGSEQDLARIAGWAPPHQITLDWFLGSGPERPSRVNIHFIEESGRTTVRVEHRGPKLIGDAWAIRKGLFSASWEAVLASFAEKV